MKEPNYRPFVQLTGEDGNAFFIMGRVSQALRRAGADQEYIDKYTTEATLNDYNALLVTTMEHVEVG